MDFSLYSQAERLVLETRRATASLLQRRLKIGYQEAAYFLEIMEDKGLISPCMWPRGRTILKKK